MLARRGLENATQGRQAETRLTMRQTSKDATDARVEVRVAIRGTGRVTCRNPPEARHRIAFAVNLLHRLGGAGRVQETALLGDKQEQEAIRKTEEFLLIILNRQRSLLKRVADSRIEPQKARTQRFNRRHDARAKSRQRAHAGFGRTSMERFPQGALRAQVEVRGGGGEGDVNARRVEQAPHEGKCREVACAAENGPKIKRQEARTGQ